MRHLPALVVAMARLWALAKGNQVVLVNGCGTGIWAYIQRNQVVPPQYDRMAVWVPPRSLESFEVPTNKEGLPEWWGGTMFFQEEANISSSYCEPPAGVALGKRAPGYWCRFVETYHATLAEWTFTNVNTAPELNGTMWFDISNVNGIGTLPIRMSPIYANVDQSTRPLQDRGCIRTETCYITEELCPVHPKYGKLWDAERRQCISDCDMCRMREWNLTGPEQDTGPCREVCCPGSTIHEQECWAKGVQANSAYAWTSKCACRTAYSYPLDDWEGVRSCNYMHQADLRIELCPASHTEEQALDLSFNTFQRSSHTGRCVDVEKAALGSHQTKQEMSAMEVFPSKTECVRACVAERSSRRRQAKSVPPVLV